MAFTARQIAILLYPKVEREANLDDLIALTEMEVSDSAFGDLRNKAVALLVLHGITMAARAGAGGFVNSERVGGVSRGYQVGNYFLDDALGQTSWGMEYLRIRDSNIVALGTLASLGGQFIPSPQEIDPDSL